jgi:hypothetical protein
MAFGNIPPDGANIPMSAVVVPGTAAPVALQGGTKFTDSLGNDSAPARAELTPGSKATYSCAFQTGTIAATATDIALLRGSSKLIKVLRVEVSGAATAATEIVCFLKKHTIANTAGTSSTPTITKHDSADGAVTGSVLLYTANPTIDASATFLRNIRMTLAVAPAATTVNPDRYIATFGVDGGEPLVLRSSAQELALNLNGVAVPAGEILDILFVWTEE